VFIRRNFSRDMFSPFLNFERKEKLVGGFSRDLSYRIGMLTASVLILLSSSRLYASTGIVNSIARGNSLPATLMEVLIFNVCVCIAGT